MMMNKVEGGEPRVLNCAPEWAGNQKLIAAIFQSAAFKVSFKILFFQEQQIYSHTKFFLSLFHHYVN